MNEERIDKLTNEVSRLSSLLVESITETRAAVRRIDEKMDEHSVSLWGPKGAASQGLTIRIDRMEQAQKDRNWVMRTFGTGIVALIAKQAWDIFTHSNK